MAHPLDQIRIVTRAYAVTTIDYCYLDSVLSSIRSRMRFIKVAIIGCCAVVRENFLLLLEKSERIGSVESYETSEAFFGEEVQSSGSSGISGGIFIGQKRDHNHDSPKKCRKTELRQI